jgi:hypothetical protein
VGVTPDSARGQRFAELLEAEPRREHVYVAGPDVSAAGSNNPLASLMSQFQALELSSAGQAAKGGHTQAGVGGESLTDSKMGGGQDILQAQANLIRSAMMLEMMNSAKQGVTTLFQQQG